MVRNKTAAASKGDGRGTKTTIAGPSNSASSSDQAARRDALVLLSRVYRMVRAEADRHDELATTIVGIARALKRGAYDPDFTIERMIDIGAFDFADGGAGTR